MGLQNSNSHPFLPKTAQTYSHVCVLLVLETGTVMARSSLDRNEKAFGDSIISKGKVPGIVSSFLGGLGSLEQFENGSNFWPGHGRCLENCIAAKLGTQTSL